LKRNEKRRRQEIIRGKDEACGEWENKKILRNKSERRGWRCTVYYTGKVELQGHEKLP
jgi:hypothetical protein